MADLKKAAAPGTGDAGAETGATPAGVAAPAGAEGAGIAPATVPASHPAGTAPPADTKE